MNTYQKEYLSQISFPLGGIGAGSIGLAGNGALVDWEIHNRPNRLSINPFSNFAIKVEDDTRVRDLRLLQGEVNRDFMGGMHIGNHSWGYGHGPNRATMAGLKHFRDLTFTGEFPVAEIAYADPAFEGAVRLTAFNPMIPGNDKDSSLPAAFFDFAVTNPSDQTLRYTIACSITNPFSGGCINRYEKTGARSMMTITSVNDRESPEYGEFVMATDCADAGYQEYWYRGGWFDNVTMFLNDFGAFGPVHNRRYDTPDARFTDTAMLTGSVELAPGECRRIRFTLAWYVPNVRKYWGDQNDPPQWKNYYATLFGSAKEVAGYCLDNSNRLSEETLTFRNALMGSSLPAVVLDAIQGNLATLKSTTCLRLENGAFYAWEGVNRDSGSCEGSCQHVWNYAYALPFLYPKLEKGVREYELACNLEDNGLMHFRTFIPLGKEKFDFRACVDGQMGTVMKIYREWKLSGDTEWLKAHWEQVKRCVTYAWEQSNRDKWDPDKRGAITGRQHHTLDVEAFGVNSWLSGFYLGALEAASRMADAVGDLDAAKEFSALAAKGRAELEQTFDPKLGYYVQKVDITDKSLLERFDKEAVDGYWDEENGEIKYQIGEGCEIDQVVADWHTALMGLPPVFDKSHRKSALERIYRNNFISMEDNNNPCRVFACNGEKGVIMCAYPKEAVKPKISVPYTEECMTGFEYAAACQMLQVGMEEQAIEIVSAIRDRYDGKKRNPWAEIECGASYARAMASYAFLLTYSGFVYDMPQKTIGFKPLHDGSYFWSVDGAWGVAECGRESLTIRVLYGGIALQRVVHALEQVNAVEKNGQAVSFVSDGDAVRIEVRLQKGDALCLGAMQ